MVQPRALCALLSLSSLLVASPGLADPAFVNHDLGLELRGFVPILRPLGETLIHAGFRTSYAIGDFDGDRRSDLVVGEPWATVDGQRAAGRVQVVMAYDSEVQQVIDVHADFATADLNAPGRAKAGDLFGFALAVGDLDGDGVDDLAIGAPGADGPGEALQAGCVFIAHGSKDGLSFDKSQVAYCPWRQALPADTLPRYLLVLPVGTERGAAVGSALAVGDFDGDRRHDLAIGAPGWQPSSAPASLRSHRTGAVIVVPFTRGGPNGGRDISILTPYRTTAPAIVTPELLAPIEDFAAGLAGASLAVGDFDGDRRDDLAIGAPGGFQGAVLLAMGTDDGLRKRDQTSRYAPDAAGRHRPPVIQNAPANAFLINTLPLRFGQALAAGDFDGDGRDDLAVGSPGQGVEGSQQTGAVYLLQGIRRGLSASHHRSGLHSAADDQHRVFDDAGAGSRIGWSLAAGDFDRDGFHDLAIGAPGWRESGRRFGAVEVRFGHRPFSIAGFEIPGGPTGARRQLLKRGFFGARRLPGLPLPEDAVGLSLAAGHLNPDRAAELLISAPGTLVTNPSGSQTANPGLGTGAMLLDGTTIIISGHPQGPLDGRQRLLHVQLPQAELWRFPDLLSQPGGVRVSSQALKNQIIAQVGGLRQTIEAGASGLRVRRLRARNFRIGTYDPAGSADTLAHDIKFDMCAINGNCCIELDIDTTVSFTCDVAGNLASTAVPERPTVRDEDLCIDAFDHVIPFGILLTDWLRDRLTRDTPQPILTTTALGSVNGIPVVCQRARLLPDLSLEIDVGLQTMSP